MKSNWNEMSSESLTNLLLHEKSINKCAIICELAKRNKHAQNTKEVLLKLKKCSDRFWNNYLVSDFSMAALHLLGFEKYKGNREEVKQLIDSKLTFTN